MLPLWRARAIIQARAGVSHGGAPRGVRTRFRVGTEGRAAAQRIGIHEQPRINVPAMLLLLLLLQQCIRSPIN